MFSYISPEGLVPQNHPLRAIRPLVNAALQRLSPQFDKIYAPSGRDSIAPERLLRALLLQALFSVRSERQLMEQITYNMMFRWFVGLSMDAAVWDVTVFTKNRERLLRGDIARGFLAAILVDPQVKPLLSDEHFSVDGTLIEAWASMKSFRPKDGSGEPPASGRNGEVDFRGEPRSNQTHASTTDADARLYKKAAGQAAKLCHIGHALMENRNGLVVDTSLTKATGTAEREAAIAMIGDLLNDGRITLGTDKGYDTQDFVAEMRRLGVTPHVTQNTKGAALPLMAAPPAMSATRQFTDPQAHRGGVWLDEDGGRLAQDAPSRHRPGRLDVYVRCGRLQLGALTQAAGWRGVAMPGVCPNAWLRPPE